MKAMEEEVDRRDESPRRRERERLFTPVTHEHRVRLTMKGERKRRTLQTPASAPVRSKAERHLNKQPRCVTACDAS